MPDGSWIFVVSKELRELVGFWRALELDRREEDGVLRLQLRALYHPDGRPEMWSRWDVLFAALDHNKAHCN